MFPVALLILFFPNYTIVNIFKVLKSKIQHDRHRLGWLWPPTISVLLLDLYFHGTMLIDF